MRFCTFLLLAMLPISALPVTLQQTADAVTVKNKFFTAAFEKNTGYALRFTHVGKRKMPYAVGRQTIFLDNELEKYEERYCPAPTPLNRMLLNPAIKILNNTAESVKLSITYPFQGGSAEEIIEIAEKPMILYDVTVNHKVRIFSNRFQMYVSGGTRDGIFLYNGERMTGVWGGSGGTRRGVTWDAAWYEKMKVGIGLAVLSGPQLRGIEYSMNGPQEGWGNELAVMNGVYGSLSDCGKAGKLHFRYAVLASSDPKDLKAQAEELVGAAPQYELLSFETEKLVVRPGEKETVFVEIRNNSGKDAEFTLKMHLTYALDKKADQPVRKMKVAAGAKQKIQIPLVLPKDLEKGTAVSCEVLGPDGKTVANAMEFFTVSDFAPRDAGFGIVNVAQANQDGSQDAWNRNFKKKYVGGYEYYCWALSVIGGLAPEEEKWYPNTEHRYDLILSKSFVKGLLDDAHSKGVGVYSWITGLWNFKYAIRQPEWMQYSKDGDPNIYSGSIRTDGSRRAVVKAHMFTPERARIWAEEMCRSIDMFGWDGCRWDWTFLPDAMCDPLYMGEDADDWYDSNGVPQSKLFPNPDKTGAECLTAWREVVHKKHPKFVFGTNYGSSQEKWNTYPEYHKVAARNAVTLFEDMLSFCEKRISTFEKWGKELTLRCDLVRRYGGAPVVGSMRGLNAGNPSYDLAHYTASSAGVKWWDSYINDLLNDDYLRNRYFLRFAEYYYSCDFRHVEKTAITVKNGDRVLWKPFLRERVKNGVRETVIPIVNLPDDGDYICQSHRVPAVRKNITFTVPGKVESVYWMNPQSPEKAVKLTVKNGTFAVPELHNAGMILVRSKGN